MLELTELIKTSVFVRDDGEGDKFKRILDILDKPVYGNYDVFGIIDSDGNLNSKDYSDEDVENLGSAVYFIYLDLLVPSLLFDVAENKFSVDKDIATNRILRTFAALSSKINKENDIEELDHEFLETICRMSLSCIASAGAQVKYDENSYAKELSKLIAENEKIKTESSKAIHNEKIIFEEYRKDAEQRINRARKEAEDLRKKEGEKSAANSIKQPVIADNPNRQRMKNKLSKI